jgi:hypothetical protein
VVSELNKPHRQECPCHNLAFPSASATASIRGAISPATTARTASGTAATTAAFTHRSSLIHYQRTSEKILTIAALYCAISFFVVPKFREAKSARLAGKLVANYLD